MTSRSLPPIPLTRKEYDTLLMLWRKLDSYIMTVVEDFPDGMSDVTPDGVETLRLKREEYGDDYEIQKTIVPIADVLDPASAIARIEAMRKSLLRQSAEQREQWDRTTYERLRQKYEHQNTP